MKLVRVPTSTAPSQAVTGSNDHAAVRLHGGMKIQNRNARVARRRRRGTGRVTTKKALYVSNIKNRNAHRVMWAKMAAQHTRRAAAFEAGIPKERRKAKLAGEALKWGDRCGRCGRRIAKDESVWRTRISVVLVAFKPRYRPTIMCRRCAGSGSDSRQDRARACEGCGRPVYPEMRGGWPWWRGWRCFCSDRCRWGFYNHRHRASNVERTCSICGRFFTPQRGDAVYCDQACRQRAYRRRCTAPREVAAV